MSATVDDVREGRVVTATRSGPEGFRNDINGLRAIAVLAVVGYHFHVPGFGGGFVGVDVFFVISGYLMTRIIVDRLDRGTFSYGGFAFDRARRIVPALTVLLAIMLALGAAFLLPQDYLALGKHVAGSATFASNLLYWRETNYFAASPEGRWLLHTWSLSVEWQFYLLFPLLVVVIHRLYGRAALAPVFAILALASFALSLVLTQRSPSSAFFLLPPRAWEMLVGGLVVWIPISAARTMRFGRAMQVLGLALIVGGIATISTAGWPGTAALVPVIGTALVIAAQLTGSRVTGNVLFAWVGLRSYSIYLWHWPVAAFVLRNDYNSSAAAVATGIGVSLILGELSYRYVERRFTGGWRSAQPLTPLVWRHAVLAMPVAAVVIAGALTWKMRGMPFRFNADVRAVERFASPGGPFTGCFSVVRDVPEPCVVGSGAPRVAVGLIGDSESEASAGGVAAAIPPGAGGMAFNGYASCVPVFGAISTDPDNKCFAFNEARLRPWLRPRTIPLILIARWSGYSGIVSPVRFGPPLAGSGPAAFRANLTATVCALARAGPTWILLPTPEFSEPVAPALQWQLARGNTDPDISYPAAQYRAARSQAEVIIKAAARQCGVGILDPEPLLCPEGQCRGTVNRLPVFRDELHITEYGNRLLTPLFRRVFLAPAPATRSAL